MSEKVKLTRRQMASLRILQQRTDDLGHGKFYASEIGNNAHILRSLEPLGLVEIYRKNPTNFRYSITDTGRAAIKEASDV